MELADFLSLFAQLLLIIALPIIIAAAVQFIRVQAQRLGEDRLNAAKSIVRTAVRVAEQTSLAEGLTGPEKRERAIQVAQSFLRRQGIALDLKQLVSLIEAEVLEQFSNPTMPADTAEARQALIDKAVEAAVLAAEQSGLKGLIPNHGPDKKAYAMAMVAEYLNQHGISLPDSLLSGLIEAQILRFTMAARGQLGASSAGSVRR